MIADTRKQVIYLMKEKASRMAMEQTDSKEPVKSVKNVRLDHDQAVALLKDVNALLETDLAWFKKHVKEKNGEIELEDKYFSFYPEVGYFLPSVLVLKGWNSGVYRSYAYPVWKWANEVQHAIAAQLFYANGNTISTLVSNDIFLAKNFNDKFRDHIAYDDGYLNNLIQGGWSAFDDDWHLYLPVLNVAVDAKKRVLALAQLCVSKVSVSDANLKEIVDRWRKLNELVGGIFERGCVFDDALLGSDETDVFSLCQLLASEIDVDSYVRWRLQRADKIRCNQNVYEEMQLLDPKKGHWDLWDSSVVGHAKAKTLSVELKEPLWARNPRQDVRKGEWVGIDFGTKSTVVVCGGGRGAEAVRVGVADYLTAPKPEHYENPTLMEFIDLASFTAAYAQTEGRPMTAWDDLKSAHAAKSDVDGTGTNILSSQAFFAELKQWAGYCNRRVVIKDVQGKTELSLSTFTELKEGDFNPIEIYAYHIGLAINNMRNGIHLRYLLSFPATFEKDVRQRILDAFGRGLKKSLPEAVLRDSELMKAFAVEMGASEPAAYAVCALQENGLEPEEKKSVQYGVFDFGGGTTDFDFGVWKLSTDAECQQGIDYVIEHFGSGGDRYLGGENLLYSMAYKVYTDPVNRDLIGKARVPLALPPNEKRAPGFESLIVDSLVGRMNLYRMACELRPLWEDLPEKSKFESGEVVFPLFSSSNERADLKLKVDAKGLMGYVQKRIERAVRDFREALHHAFASNARKIPKNPYPIHIFLAGNSSKSNLVDEAFKKIFNGEAEGALLKDMGVEKPEDVGNIFEIHAPLGFGSGENASKPFALQPTGKTGVAFGLVYSRPGGPIKVVDSNVSAVNEEVHFRYYFGLQQRRKLKVTLRPETSYGQWKPLCAVREDALVDVYYTSSSEVLSGEMCIANNPMVHNAIVEVNENHRPADWILVRCVKPEVIEWCLGTAKGVPNKGAKPHELKLS